MAETSLFRELAIFVFLTGILGGAAAWSTGRAVAQMWSSRLLVAGYVVLLAGGVRFLHYALYQGEFLGVGRFLLDAITLLAVALTSYHLARAQQMTERYPWLFERTGLFSWRDREGDPPSA